MKAKRYSKKKMYLIALNIDRLGTHSRLDCSSRLDFMRSMRSPPKDCEGSITNEMKNSFCTKECSYFIPPFCYQKVSYTLSR